MEVINLYQFSLDFLNRYDCYTVNFHRPYSERSALVLGRVVAETANRAAEVFFHSNGFEDSSKFISRFLPMRRLCVVEQPYATAPRPASFRYAYNQIIGKRYAYVKDKFNHDFEDIEWYISDHPLEGYEEPWMIFAVESIFNCRSFRESLKDGMDENCLYFSTEEARKEVLRFLEGVSN